MARTPAALADSASPAHSPGAKPRLRGWIHSVMAPIALVIGLVLVIGSPSTTAAVTTTIFAFTTVLLFTTSAVYHRGTWSPACTTRCGGWITRTSSW
ncbi:hemolysin III family protein [Ruania alba]|uniref:hemolysin III family protein n=1 Tax=Ruania alba TaxID=648782 RepID=UPI000A5BF8E7